MIDLKPCPFCGSKPYLSPGKTRYYVKHGSACRLNDSYNDDVVHVCFAKDDVEGYTGWNDRPTEDALKAQIAKLQADNRSLVEQMNKMAMKPNQDVIEWHDYPDERPVSDGSLNRVLIIEYKYGEIVDVATAECYFPIHNLESGFFEFERLMDGITIIRWAYLPKGVNHD